MGSNYHTIARSRVQTPLKSWLFQASVHNCLNCIQNCDDHGLVDFKPAVHYMKHFIYHLIMCWKNWQPVANFMRTLDRVEGSVGRSVGSVGKAVGDPLGKRWKSVWIYPLTGKVLVYVFLWEVTFVKVKSNMTSASISQGLIKRRFQTSFWFRGWISLVMTITEAQRALFRNLHKLKYMLTWRQLPPDLEALCFSDVGLNIFLNSTIVGSPSRKTLSNERPCDLPLKRVQLDWLVSKC